MIGEMLTRLIITEKPSVAMRYAAVPGVKGRQDGYLEGRGYLISWCFGHLWGLADAVAYDPKYKKWNQTDLPILPATWQYQLLPGSQKQMALLRHLMDRADVTEIVNACDPGREGELIFRNVYNLAQCTKPMLRLWVSSMEDEAIRKGFAHLRPGLAFNGVYEAALCRAQADWLVGINATRLFSTAYHRTLVIGRVISPTLSMVVNREQEIAGHKPETFYRVCLTCEGVVFQSEKMDQAQAEALAAQCAGQTAVVEELRETEQVRTAPALLDLTALQRLANKQLGYTAQQVAGFRKWQNQFGRHVKKGEHGITIIAPTPYKKKIEAQKLDPDTKAPVLDENGQAVMEEKEVVIPLFRPVKVFDVAQTDGKPLPELVESLTGDVQQYEIFLEALRRSAPVPISLEPLPANLDGYFSPKEQRIAIREGMSEVQTISAVIHEIAHSKLHDVTKCQAEEEPKPKDRNTEEVEAESISYAVCQYYGIETSGNSFGYIATWSKDKDLPELRASLETINQTSGALISDIDRHFNAILQERGLALPTQEADNPLRNAEMAVEDDYNMIDGILNNGARETPAKEKLSLLERIKCQPKMERKNAAPQKSAEMEI